MLPILATIGNGLAWFAVTAGNLIFWGFNICIGYWLGRKLTNVWDAWNHKRLARKRHKELEEELDSGLATAAAAHA